MDVSADAAIAVQADHFTISQQEVSALAGEYQLFRNYQADEAREKALEQLIEEYAVYTYATAQGYEADEAALDAMVADAQDAEEMSEDERQSFLQSFDGDEELYWSLYREDMRMYQTIDGFQDDYRSTYDGSDFYEAWLALVDEIVAGEHAQVL
jgi:parvulin-like peptidyl-prolyl isomerase